MKRLKMHIFIFLTLILNSCGLGLDNEIDKDIALKLINQRVENFTEDQVKSCNAQQVHIVDGDYLFVANSFNGDFNGLVYSVKEKPIMAKMKFNDLYIVNFDKTEKHWTKVYGKW